VPSGSPQPGTDIKMRLRATDRPRVPDPIVGDKLTVWYENGGQVAGWRGAVVCLRREGAEILVRFDAMPPHHADKEAWIDIAEDEWALGSHWRRTPSSAQIVEACAKARGASKAAAAALKAAAAAVAAATTLAVTAATLATPTLAAAVDASASSHIAPTLCAVASSGRAWPPQFAAALYELAGLHETMARAGWVPNRPSLALYVSILDEKGLTGIVDAGISLLSRVPPIHWRPSRRWWHVGREACISLLRVATYQPPPLRASMLDGYGHGKEEEDAPRGEGRGAPDKGDRVEEGDSPDEEGGEDAADEEEEGDDEFEDEVEEHGDDDNFEADGEREAARDAT